MRIAVVCLASALLSPLPGRAQCVSNLSADLVGMGRVVDSLVEVLVDAGGNVQRRMAVDSVANIALFAAGVSAAGRETAACLLLRHQQFVEAARNGLGDHEGDTLTKAAFSDILQEAVAAALADRYQVSDRFAVFFALGFASAIDSEDIEKFKIVKRSGAADSTGAVTDTSFVVRESNSEGIPAAMTGLLVRFRDVPTGGSLATRFARRLIPNSAFVSAQLSGGDIGIVNGASIGLGWNIVGSAHLLLGFSLARTRSLREDIRRDWEASPSKRLRLAAGETEESIMGIETANFINIAIGVPISIGSSLGGGG